MKINEIFIRKPVLTIVFNLLILLVGISAYFKLPLREFPKIHSSVISVNTSLLGSSEKLMENTVTAPLERAISGIKGVNYIASSSMMNSSNINIIFNIGYDIQQAISDIQSKIQAIKYQMPNGVSGPTIIKQDPNAQPIIYISFSSSKLSLEKITHYLKRFAVPVFENIDGVAVANIIGKKNIAMKIMLNPNKMTSHHVSSEDVVRAINNSHIHPPAGRIESEEEEHELIANTELNSEKQFDHLVVLHNNHSNTLLRDIGKAKLGPTESKSSVLLNGKPAILIAIMARSDANPLMISSGVKRQLKILTEQMPKGLSASIVWDTSLFIDRSIHEVNKTILKSTVFVIAVMLFFLGSLRILFIPIITIPLSLVGICIFLYLLHFSLNTMTMLAMVLSIGLVVDDSIVVSENIHRYIEKGFSPINAAIKGSQEIQFAIIAMTLTLSAVFAPIGFLSGLTGALFKEFSFTLAGTVIISGIIALTLSPMMCSKLMTSDSFNGKVLTKINSCLNSIIHHYSFFLKFILKRKMIIPVLLMMSIPVDFLFYHSIIKELAPKEDMGAVLTIAQGPLNSNFKHTEKFSKQIDDIIEKTPEKKEIMLINGSAGVNSAMAFVTLLPWEQRSRNADQIANVLNPKLWNISGMRAFAINPYQLPGSHGAMPVNFILQTTGSYNLLYSALQTVLQKISKSKMFLNVRSNLAIRTSKSLVEIDRALADDVGVSMSSVANALSVSIGNPILTSFTLDGDNYDVIPKLYPEFKQTDQDMLSLPVRTSNDNIILLSSISKIKKVTGPNILRHFNQLRSANITAGLAQGVNLKDAMDFFKNVMSSLKTPDIQYSFGGEMRQFIKSNNMMISTFFFSVLFIYLLLSAQFESFLLPLIVLSSLFFSVTGSLCMLKICNYSINIYTQIGLLTLIGLISKHGILIVEFAKQLQAQGKSAKEAIIEASTIRLRPILMTTAAMVLGAVPLAFASGPGAISRKQIGLVIISGMSMGTMMTIFVVPAMYLVVRELIPFTFPSSSRLQG